MATVQFESENIIEFYGTNQKQTVRFGIAKTFQILGLVPCNEVLESCPVAPCDTLTVFDTDFNSFLFQYADLSQAVVFNLEQYVNNSWVLVTELSASEGIKYNLGDFENHEDYAGYRIDWSKVFDLYGNGVYRFVAYNATSPANSLYSLAFSLLEFDCNKANDTVYITTTQQGKYSNINYSEANGQNRDYDVSDFEWIDSVRHKGKLIPTSPEVTEEDIRYSNNRTQKYFSDQRQAYDLRLYSPLYDNARRFFYYGLKASKVILTNNSKDSVDVFENKNIIGGEEFNFETFRYYNKLEDVVIPVFDEYASDFKR